MCLVSFSKVKEYSSKEKLTKFDGQTPLWAYINITSQCSHLCKWCYGGFNGNLKQEMHIDNFIVVLEKLKEIGILQVSITGGEPTEHPNFLQFIEETAKRGFLIHVVTNGEKIIDFVAELEKFKVKQVQFNYQGKRFHDREHGIANAYQTQLKSIKSILKTNIEATATVTVGQYNLKYLHEIFSEIKEVGFNRFRIWESTGRGNKFRKSIEAKQIFTTSSSIAKKIGYNYIQSYDPNFTGDIGVKCPPMSNLAMIINTEYKLRFCCALLLVEDLADFTSDSSEKILSAYQRNNAKLPKSNNNEAYCITREGY